MGQVVFLTICTAIASWTHFRLTCFARNLAQKAIQGFHSPAYLGVSAIPLAAWDDWQTESPVILLAKGIREPLLPVKFAVYFGTNSLYHINKIRSSLDILKSRNLPISRRKRGPSVCPWWGDDEDERVSDRQQHGRHEDLGSWKASPPAAWAPGNQRPTQGSNLALSEREDVWKTNEYL